MLGKSVNGFAHGRDTGGRHVESAGNLIFHSVTVSHIGRKTAAISRVAKQLQISARKQKCNGRGSRQCRMYHFTDVSKIANVWT